MIRTNLPELGTEEIWFRDAEKCQCCHGARELEYHQGDEDSRPFPPPGYDDAWEFEHREGGLLSLEERGEIVGERDWDESSEGQLGRSLSTSSWC